VPNPAELTGVILGAIPGVQPGEILPLNPAQLLSAMTTGHVRRCPGFAERDPGDGSTPFTDAGALTDGLAANGECDPSQVGPGP
jgi:hypothetical protein